MRGADVGPEGEAALLRGDDRRRGRRRGCHRHAESGVANLGRHLVEGQTPGVQRLGGHHLPGVTTNLADEAGIGGAHHQTEQGDGDQHLEQGVAGDGGA